MSPQTKTAFSATNLEFSPDVVLDVAADCGIGEELWKR
jgi:hypothetical protein